MLHILFNASREYDYDYIFSDFERIEDTKNQRVDRYNYSKDMIFKGTNIREYAERAI